MYPAYPGIGRLLHIHKCVYKYNIDYTSHAQSSVYSLSIYRNVPKKVTIFNVYVLCIYYYYSCVPMHGYQSAILYRLHGYIACILYNLLLNSQLG